MRLFQINTLFIFLFSLPFCAVAVPRKQHAFIEVEIPDTEIHCTNTDTPISWGLNVYTAKTGCVNPSTFIQKEGQASCTIQDIVSFSFNALSDQIMICVYEDTDCKKPVGGWPRSDLCHNPGTKGLAYKVIPVTSAC